MEEETLSNMPANELEDVLDMVIWNMSHAGQIDVERWREELLARPDAGSEDVQRGIAVCDDYLASPGSPEEYAAAVRARGR